LILSKNLSKHPKCEITSIYFELEIGSLNSISSNSSFKMDLNDAKYIESI
jgi:hypothetical protein